MLFFQHHELDGNTTDGASHAEQGIFGNGDDWSAVLGFLGVFEWAWSLCSHERFENAKRFSGIAATQQGSFL